MRNSSTIYDKEIEIWEKEFTDSKLSVRAMPTPNSKSFMANIMIIDEVGEDDITLVLDKDDAIEFAGELITVSMKHTEISVLEYSSTLANNIKMNYNICISRLSEDEISIDISANISDGKAVAIMDIPVDSVREFADAIVRSCEQATDILDANKNLAKQLELLRKDMKNDKVKELHFEILDNLPKMYNDEEDRMRIYEVIPYGYDDNPTGYSFLRIMHLTCVPAVDYRDHGNEYLMCPFIYSEKMMERGKKFLDSKKTDLHLYVDSKTGKA